MALFQPNRAKVSSTPTRQPAPWGASGIAAPPAGFDGPSSPATSQPGPWNVGGPAVPPRGRGSGLGFEAVRASRDFWTIRRRFGSFVGPACALFIGWYFLYVVIAVFAPRFMRTSVFGDVNVGLCFGVLQFVSTFVIAASYRRWARRRLDPLSDRLRNRLEGGRRE